jgi:hypothetical protein
VNGASLTVAAQFAYQDGEGELLVGLVNDATVTCDAVSTIAGPGPAYDTMESLTLTFPSAVGSYDVGFQRVWFAPTGCTAGTEVATAGTVHVTELSDTRVKGTFSVAFGTHGALAGSFDAPLCIGPRSSGLVLGTPECP